MNKEDVLKMSRKENKDKDLFALEVQNRAGIVSMITAIAIATTFFIAQYLLGLGVNFGLYAILAATGAADLIYKAYHLKRRKDIVFAFIYMIAASTFTIIHICQLITSRV